MSSSVAGQIALITGAGRGIGMATAEAFARTGASVVLADRDGEAAAQAAERIRGAGGNAIAITCDVTDRVQVDALIEHAVATYGRLDAAFNNAGVNCNAATLLDTSD